MKKQLLGLTLASSFMLLSFTAYGKCIDLKGTYRFKGMKKHVPDTRELVDQCIYPYQLIPIQLI